MALLCVAAMFVGCARTPRAAPSPTELHVHRGDLVQRYLLTGELEAVERAEVKVPRTREYRLQIQRLAADGSTVAKGDVVLEFDNSNVTANLDQQRSAVQLTYRTLLQNRASGDARLRESEAAVERARIAVAKARVDASVPGSIRSRFDQRTSELQAIKAQAEYEKALADLESTRVAVTAETRIAEEEHRKSERELAVAETALAALSLTAPQEGIVVVDENPWEDRKFQVGDTVFPGWTVLGIPDLERLRVRASLSDVDDGSIEVGMTARCIPDIEPDLVIDGRVVSITPIAREQRVFSERRGFDLTIELESSWGDVLLVPGMSIRVEIERTAPDLLLVPRAALDLTSDPPRARRANGTWAEVEIGVCSATMCELAQGLDAGDRLTRVRSVGS